MKVKELIEELKTLNEDDTVMIQTNNGVESIKNICSSTDADYKEIYLEGELQWLDIFHGYVETLIHITLHTMTIKLLEKFWWINLISAIKNQKEFLINF